MEIAATTLDQVSDLYQQGLYLQAYEAAKPLGPLHEWTGTAARVLGGRLAANLGSLKLARVMHRWAHRDDPEDPEATYFFAMSIYTRRGPYATWELLRKLGDVDMGSDRLRADWLALHADILAVLRDFEAAEQHIEKALELCPDRSWIWVQRAFLLEMQDKHEEALETATRAFDLRPWYRPAVQSLAHRLVQLNRDEEALELLKQGNERLESGDLILQLAGLQVELEQYEDARESYERAEAALPLMHQHKNRKKWMAARHADAAYYCGDFATAARIAKEADNPFYDKLAEKLSSEAPEGKRVVLPVKFVRQHHLTCAPATLSAISGFWSKPADHLEVAEKICYDGTPAHSERRWAEQNGFLAREFRVTWDAGTRLIDLGIPFTLTTVDPGNAHLQAVIGYDSYRGSLIVRDPTERHFGEAAAEKMLEHYGPSGPRGMVMVPKEEAAKLEGVELPETELYDLYYELELALDGHRRQDAQGVLEKMREHDPNHRLTIRGRGNLASYDADLSDLLVCTEQLLKKYPKDVNLLLSKLSCLQELGRRDDRIALLQELRQSPDCDPLFWTRLAQELREDSRENDEVRYLLKQAIRYRPHDAQAYSMLAGVIWEEDRRSEAMQVYRFAACLDDKNESHARGYFQAARHLQQSDKALQFLRDRFDRFGALSHWPARTLCWAYDQLERAKDALGVVDLALAKRPEDGDLMLYAADFHGRYGEFEKSRQLVARAEHHTHRINWLRVSAAAEMYEGDLTAALDKWRQLLELDPLASDAHNAVADLLADLEDSDAAIAHLQRAVERFPHSYALNTLLIEWLRDGDPSVAEATLRQFVELHPTDPWARRELGFVLYGQKQYDEALAEANLADELDPGSPVTSFLKARVYGSQGEIEAAREQYRESIRQSVDYDPSVIGLITTCDLKADRERELNFIQQELKRQVTFGDGLLTFREYAQNTLDPEQLLTVLKEALEARPDLWHAWSAVGQQLTEMDRLDEALSYAEQATERFPLLPRIWVDKSLICRGQGNTEAEIEALRQAARINPSWSEPARQLCEVYEKQGELEKAKEVMERAIACEPREVRNHGGLAEVLWKLDDRQAAVEKLEYAVRIQPGYEWAWEKLREWYEELEQPQRLAELARELTEKRPSEARSWFILAETLDQPEDAEEAYAALGRAISLNPRNPQAYSMWAYYLTRDGRFDEAIQVCKPQAFGDTIPLELAGRAAWVEAQRGNVEEAIRQMRVVLDQDPDYVWAWRQLIDWHDQPEHEEELHEAAQQMARLAPTFPVSWGYLADAALRLERNDEAKQHLQRAIELAPEYSWASGTLFNMQLEDKELEGAAATLARTADHMPPEWKLSDEIRLAIHQENKELAFGKMHELIRFDTEETEPLDAVGGALWNAGWGDEAQQVLSAELLNPEVHTPAGFVFVNLCSTLELWEVCRHRLDEITQRPDMWRVASQKFAKECSTEDQPAMLLGYRQAYRSQLAEDTKTWAAMGDAFLTLGLNKELIDWMSDWRSKRDLTPTALFPLVVAYWEAKQPEKAEEICAAARRLEPDRAMSLHNLWSGVYASIYGDYTTAEDCLAEVDVESLNLFYQKLHHLVTTVLTALLEGNSYSAAEARLQAVWLGMGGDEEEDKLTKRIHTMWHWRIAKHFGRPLWAVWYKMKLAFT